MIAEAIYSGTASNLVGMLVLGAIAIVIAYNLAVKFWPTLKSSAVGTTVVSGENYTAYEALVVIAKLEQIQADPKAVEAVQYLLGMIMNAPATTSQPVATSSPAAASKIMGGK
jgi:hypothetical protein